MGSLLSQSPETSHEEKHEQFAVMTTFNREKYKQLAFEMMRERGVKLYLHCFFSDVIRDETGNPCGIIVESKNGREVIEAKRIIDTAGHGDVAYRAGCALFPHPEPYDAGMLYAMANVNIPRLAAYLDAEGVLTNLARGDKGSMKGPNIRVAAYFNGDPRLKALANSLGVWGLYPFSCHEDELTYINGSNAKGLSDFSPDEIGLYGFHDLAPLRHIKDGGWYGIPYRALIPKGVDHLLAAGRMITSDKTAHMSTRNSASCMLQGQAVGTAAALSVQLDVTPRNLDTDILRDRLRRDGVCLDD